MTTTNPGTTNDAPATSMTAAPATSEERPLDSATAATATVTQQTGAPVSGSSNISSKNGDSDCLSFAYLATDGDNSGASRATGFVAPSVNPAASTVSTVHSTLPQAIGVTVTGPNGQTSVTFPSFVTVLSTATESDGTVVTESAVVSNPTGLGQPDKNGNSSYVFLLIFQLTNLNMFIDFLVTQVLSRELLPPLELLYSRSLRCFWFAVVVGADREHEPDG